MSEENLPFRILSLDGGGPWALIQACALEEIFHGMTGHQILGQFDLAIGNSGGSITLAGLVKNLSPAEIRDLFLRKENRDQVFVPRNVVIKEIAELAHIGAKWDAAAKFTGLRALMNGLPAPVVGDLPMTELPGLVNDTTRRDIQLIITAFDYDRNREVFFRGKASSLSSKAAQFVPSLAGAVHASSNAPVNYFDAPAEVEDVTTTPPIQRRFWDGGVGGYNNPVHHAVIEALRSGVDPQDIRAPSIGTATVWQPEGPPKQGESEGFFRKREKPSLLTDIPKMATAILDDPPDVSTLDAHVVTRAPDERPLVIRLNPMIRPESVNGRWKLPAGFFRLLPGQDPKSGEAALRAFAMMRDMPMDAVKQDQVEMIHRLAQQWIAGSIPNQPIRQNSDTAECEVGWGTFEGGKKAWESMNSERVMV